MMIEPLIGKIRRVDVAILADDVGAPAVLMNASACVEAGRRLISDSSIRCTSNNDTTTILRRPAFDPVDILAMDQKIAQPDSPGHNQVRSDR